MGILTLTGSPDLEPGAKRRKMPRKHVSIQMYPRKSPGYGLILVWRNCEFGLNGTLFPFFRVNSFFEFFIVYATILSVLVDKIGR